MSLRFIFSALVALALFFAPAARMSDGGMAMAAVGAVAGAAAEGHCSGSVEHSGAKKSGAGISCASACAAVQATLPLVVGQVDVEHVRERETSRPSLAGISTEFETPPPRG